MKEPYVSIIIVNWNGGEVLRDCLKSLERIKYIKWELILVDNNSTDGSDKFAKQILQNTPVTIICNKKNLGFSPANNQGYKKAKGKYLLLLNNDTKVTPDFLGLMVRRMEEDKNLGAIQPKIYMMDKPGYLDNAGSFYTRIGFLQHWGFMKKDSAEYQEEKLIFSAKGACMLIRKSVVNKVGLFDDKFVSYFEESDFCWRVWLSGNKVLFFPKAVIFHKVGFTIKRLKVLNINFDYYKNRLCSLIKNLEISSLLYTLPLHIFVSLGIAGFFMAKGNFNNSFMIVRAILWNVLNIASTLKLRRTVQKIRVVTDRDIFSKLMQRINWLQYRADLKRIEEDIKASK